MSFFFCSNSTLFPDSEYEALRELYLTAKGDGWIWKPMSAGNVWDFSVYLNPCDQKWQGLNCSVNAAQNTSYVQELVLAGYNMTGYLTDSLGNFPKLVKLELKNNTLVGTVPAGLGFLTSLEVLNLNRNKFTKYLPQSLGHLSRLTLLDFYDNELTGPFPPFVQRLTKLTYMDLSFNKLTGTLPNFIGSLTQMERFYVEKNKLVGEIPSTIGNWAKVIDLYLNNNEFDHSIPREISLLQSLTYLFLQYNNLDGNLNGVFNSTTQVNLSIVLLSNNQLRGALPDELFLLPSLNVLDAGTNCIENNPLTKSICNATNLHTLALDGMHASRHCREPVIHGNRDTYQLHPAIKQDIDSCIYELPKLITLHLSSNGLRHKLPEQVNFAPTFTNLGMSHNFLHDNIPEVFQTRRWTSLDLSYNELNGVLIPSFAQVRDGATLSLRVNRLSGTLPQNIINAPSSISVLEGNLFYCKQDGGGLPQKDEYMQQYQCGSNLFNLSYYVWLSMMGALVVAGMLFLAYRRDKKISFNTTIGRFMYNARRAIDIADIKLDFEEFEFDVGRPAIVSIDADEEESVPKTVHDPRLVKIRLRNYHRICCICKLILRTSVVLTVYILVILLPLYGAISVRYNTITHQYAYQVSLTYAHGVEPLVLSLVFLMMGRVFVSRWFVHFYTEFKATFEAFEREIGVQPTRADTTSSFSSTEASDSSIVIYLGRGKGVIYMLLIAFNAGVVVSANGIFIDMLNRNPTSLSLAQFTLSVFKIFWAWVCSKVTQLVAKQFDKHDASLKRGLTTTLCVITLFNNIVVPYLVVMFITTSCFRNAYKPGHEITSKFTYEDCAVYEDHECQSATTTAFSELSPPFVYSSQCSGTILAYYAPSFVYMCIIQGMLQPFVRWIVQRYLPYVEEYVPRKKYPLPYTMFYWCIPLILKPVPAVLEAPPAQKGPYFDARGFIATLLNYLAVLLTFGVVFPPLAVSLTMTIISTVFFARLEIKRFFKDAARKGSALYIDRIDKECVGIGSFVLLKRAITLLATLSYWFYALFLFDIVGTGGEFRNSFWVFVVMIFLPAVLMGCYEVYCFGFWLRREFFPKTTQKDNILHMDEAETVSPLGRQRPVSGIEMSVLPTLKDQLSTSPTV